jgi:hypothetical protein
MVAGREKRRNHGKKNVQQKMGWIEGGNYQAKASLSLVRDQHLTKYQFISGATVWGAPRN